MASHTAETIAAAHSRRLRRRGTSDTEVIVDQWRGAEKATLAELNGMARRVGTALTACTWCAIVSVSPLFWRDVKTRFFHVRTQSFAG
jgi:hypothetical protein